MFSGVRILQQDPVENLFSFIGLSNYHISKISGDDVKRISDYTDYYSFPMRSAQLHFWPSDHST